MLQTIKLKSFAETLGNEASPALNSKKIEGLCLGLLSLIVFFGNSQLRWSIPANSQWIWLGIYLVSFPHFIFSYFLFYRDSKLRKEKPLIGWVLPTVLVTFLGGLVCISDRLGIVGLARLAYPLLFWHFLKQVYGVSLVCANLSELPRSKYFRRVLFWTCALIGATGYVSTQISSIPIIIFEVYAPTLQLPIVMVEILTVLSVIAYASLVGITLKENICFSALVPVLTLFIWMSPQFTRNGFFLLLPILHGLQYLPYCFRRIGESKFDSIPGRFHPLLWFLFLVIGFSVIKVLPPILGSTLQLEHPERLGAAFFLFMNLHHYAMDAVLWRSPRR